MPSQTWGPLTSGNVFQEDGVTVCGTGNGAGVITINPATIVQFGNVGNNTLTIQAGTTVKFGAGSRLRLRATASFFGTLLCQGTSSNPVVLTSVAASPAAGDWVGIDCVGGTAANIQVIDLDFTTIEFAQSPISSQAAVGFTLGADVDCDHCIIRRFSTSCVTQQAGQGGPHPWIFNFCQFYNYGVDYSGALNFISCLTPGGVPTEDEKARVELYNCTLYVEESSGFNTIYLNVGNAARMTVRDCIFVGTNASGGVVRLASLGVTDVVFVHDHNFYFIEDLDEYVPDLTDQNVDPAFFSTTAPTPNLSPDAQVGSPDLYLASSLGIYVGALEPYNYPPGGGIDPEGTVGVWAGRKQRVYPVSFGSDATRARAIRVGISTSDLKGLRHLAGILIQSSEERAK